MAEPHHLNGRGMHTNYESTCTCTCTVSPKFDRERGNRGSCYLTRNLVSSVFWTCTCTCSSPVNWGYIYHSIKRVLIIIICMNVACVS